MKLTTSSIASLTLPPGIDDRIFFCDTLKGFGVRLRRSGDRSYWVQYGIGGKTRKIRLGSVAELDIRKARDTAKDILAQIRLGGDPAHEKANNRIRAGETFGTLLRPFMIRQQGRLKPRSIIETRRHLEKLCKPLHALPITAIDRRVIATRLMEIATTNGPAAANRTKGSLGAFMSWAVREGLRDDNPASLTNKAIENGPRSRLLSDSELALIWQALRDDDYGTVVRLLILTGLRRGEIGELRWSEVDLEAGLIRLPPGRVKNGREHLVPLAPPARALLEAQPRRGDHDRVFHVSSWNNAKVELDQRIAEKINGGAPLEGWVVHDLRRKFSTALHDELGVLPHIIEVLLGHIGHRAGTAGVYNQATYLPECTRVLSKWADHITALVTGEKAPPAHGNPDQLGTPCRQPMNNPPEEHFRMRPPRPAENRKSNRLVERRATAAKSSAPQ
jgi:integrase